jgi:hypothetical protein
MSVVIDGRAERPALIVENVPALDADTCVEEVLAVVTGATVDPDDRRSCSDLAHAELRRLISSWQIPLFLAGPMTHSVDDDLETP